MSEKKSVEYLIFSTGNTRVLIEAQNCLQSFAELCHALNVVPMYTKDDAQYVRRNMKCSITPLMLVDRKIEKLYPIQAEMLYADKTKEDLRHRCDEIDDFLARFQLDNGGVVVIKVDPNRDLYNLIADIHRGLQIIDYQKIGEINNIRSLRDQSHALTCAYISFTQ